MELKVSSDHVALYFLLLLNVENISLFYSEIDLTTLDPKTYIDFHMVYVNENMHL